MRLACAAAALAAFAAPASAQAEGRIVAMAPQRYATPEVTIAQGEAVRFVNQDVTRHDVVAEDADAEGRPRFRSPLVDPGGEALVAGADRVPAGDYAFLCSVHPSMRGVLHVTAAGAPPPPPGADTTPPVVRLEVPAQRRRSVAGAGTLRVVVEADEPVTVRLAASMRRGGRSVALGRLRVTLDAAGTRSVRLRVTRRARRALRRARTATVVLTAAVEDAAGNEAVATARRRLR